MNETNEGGRLGQGRRTRGLKNAMEDPEETRKYDSTNPDFPKE